MKSDLRFKSAGIHERTPKQYQYKGDDKLAHEALIAYVRRRGDLVMDVKHDLVFNRQSVQGGGKQKVKLISGGGSGHEPMHIGFVGNNLLDAVVVGDVFASPAPPQIRAAIEHLTNEAGIILIVKNYTGDKLNFAFASTQVGCRVNTVYVTDDISLPPDPTVGRRGLAGTILIHKILGAAAADGQDLAQLTALGNKVNSSLATIGCSLDACVLPTGVASFQVAQDELAVGSGVTNEPGPERKRPIPDMHDLAEYMIDRIINNDHGVKFSEGDQVAVLVNNLGGTSAIELEYMASKVHKCLENRGLLIKRVLTGAFCTALNGVGISVTLLNFKLAGEESLRFFDIPVPDCEAWPRTTNLQDNWKMISPPKFFGESAMVSECTQLQSIRVTPQYWHEAVLRMIRSFEKHLDLLTTWDTMTGDGDCGRSMLAGAKALLADAEHKIDESNTLTAAKILADVVNQLLGRMGGTMGAFICIFLSAVNAPSPNKSDQISALEVWAVKLTDGLDELMKFTQARRGDRTFMDALIPFVEELKNTNDVHTALEAARRGILATHNMQPRFGRAKYHDSETILNSNCLDAGAASIGIILGACCQVDMDFTAS